MVPLAASLNAEVGSLVAAPEVLELLGAGDVAGAVR